MILESIAAAALGSTGIVGTGGSSDVARMLANKIEEERRRLRESYMLGGDSNAAFLNLCAIADECRVPNWDGYGALPVGAETFMYAAQFLRTMPLGAAVPSVGIEPDGSVTLEWHRSPYRTLSVSVSPSGDLHYSALIGSNKAYGTEAFLGDIPSAILDLIRRINTE